MEQPRHDLRAFQTSAISPRRLIAGAAAIGLQALAIWALATGLASQLIQKLPEEIKAEVVQQKPPEEQKTPPPPPPEMTKPPPPYVPPPDIVIQTEAPSTNSITVQSKKETPPPITAPASTGKPHECGSHYYPPLAIRLNHQGVTVVEFTIEADGSVTNAHVVKSSGYDELDNASIPCTQSWTYRPALLNGKPIATTHTADVIWKLQ